MNDNAGNLKRITLYSTRSIVLLCAGCAFEISSSELGAMILNALNPDSAVNTGMLSGTIIVIAILLFYFIANSLKKPISSYDNDLPKFLGVVYGFIVSFADNFTGERIKDSLFDGLGAAGMPDYAIVILLIGVGAIVSLSNICYTLLRKKGSRIFVRRKPIQRAHREVVVLVHISL